ncbi:MAG: hypothetical protein ACRENL_01010 [Candidatus Dormibacteria bacterium]
MPATVQRSARGLSPILLVLAALCFLLPFVGVSCNTTAGEAALGSALAQAGGAGNSGNAAAASSCLRALSGRDLATYSGADLVGGGNPTIDTRIPGCSSSQSAPTPSHAGIGVQPLMVAALLLIVAGMAAAVLRVPIRAAVAASAALVAAALIIIDNLAVHTPIISQLTASSGSSLSNLSSLGITGGLGLESFFNIHAAIGFLLVLIALLLALGVNVAALVLGTRPGPGLVASEGRQQPPGPAHPPPPAPLIT